MKKFFKSPDEAKKSDPKSVMKILGKVFNKGVEGAKFFYKAEFEYANGETGPFMYIGSPAGPWKMFIKSSKKDKDFVAGLCKLEIEGNDQKLLMKGEMGKGSKALFLKAVNKELLRKNGVKGEFVDELVVSIAPEEGEEEEAEAEAAAGTTTEPAPVSKLSPQEMANELKSIAETFKNIRVDHDSEQIDDLLDKIADWEDNYEGLPDEHKKALSASLAKAQEVSAYLQKINQIDSAIDSYLEGTVYPMMDDYLAMDDHASPEAVALKAKLEKALTKVEAFATKINDKDFLDACKTYREVIAG